jgi:hypothetical protein
MVRRFARVIVEMAWTTVGQERAGSMPSLAEMRASSASSEMPWKS